MRGRHLRLGPRGRVAVGALAVVQVTLLVVAARDLVRRPPELVNGPKWAWAPVLALNTVGPLAYLRWGRRTADENEDSRI